MAERQIIFRGKKVDNGEWTEGYLFKQWNRTFLLWGMTGDIPNMIEVIPETVGQFTGLTDKNGKKVFEGDIIDYTWDTLCGGKEHRTYVISYANNEAKFVGDCVIGNPRHSLPTFEYIGERGEVIGNIYDNKEILEGKE